VPGLRAELIAQASHRPSAQSLHEATRAFVQQQRAARGCSEFLRGKLGDARAGIRAGIVAPRSCRLAEVAARPCHAPPNGANAQPAAATSPTTSQGGVRQKTSTVKAPSAMAKSATDRMPLVHTGS
jgi:hypothetical protein